MNAARAEIEAAIPHRDPFLFVDEICDRAENSIDCAWRVPPDADWFRGHYPGQPVQPGALTCEHVFQVAAVYIAAVLEGLGSEDGVPVLTRIQDARFRRMVAPGENITTKITREERVGPAWYMSGRSSVGGQRVLEIRFALTATGAIARVPGD